MKFLLKGRNLYLLSLVLIIFLSAFLRFHNLPQLFVFTADEEYQTTLAKTLVDNFHIIWIGVSAANLDFYLGPFWTYFTAFWLFLSKGDPLITGYVSSFIGVLTTMLIFVTGWRLFNPKVGLVSSLLYACLPLMVFFDQKYWNPSIIPFLSLLIVLAIYETRNSDKWWIVVAIAFGLIFHVHLSLVPLGLLAFYWLLRKQNITKQTLIFCILAFIVTISPLIVFDYFHKFSNITVPLRINQISSTDSTRFNPVQHLVALWESMGRLFYLFPFSSNADEILHSCNQFRSKPVLAISALVLGILLFFLLRKKTWREDNTKLLALATLIILVSFLIFPGSANEYYLLGFYPLLLLILGIVSESMKILVKNIFLACLALLCFVSVMTVLTSQGGYGMQTKKDLIDKVTSKIGNNTFDLQEEGDCHKYEGWRYLFTVYGHKPERSSADKSLGWLYPKDVSPVQTKYSIIMSENRVPVKFNTKDSIKISENGFDAYIYKNY